MSYLLFLPNASIFSQGDFFSKHMPKSLWGSVVFFGGGGGGGHFCVTVPCLCHLQHSFAKHITRGILQFMAFGQSNVLVSSAEAVIKTCFDSI